MLNKETTTYSIVGHIKTLGEKLSSKKIEIISLIIGFLLNIITIVLTLLKGDIPSKIFVIVCCIVMGIPIIVIVVLCLKIYVIDRKIISKKLTAKELGVLFEEYVVPNVKCALELAKDIEEIDGNGTECEKLGKKMFEIEMLYHFRNAICKLKDITKSSEKDSVIEIITKERWNSIWIIIMDIDNRFALSQRDEELNKDMKILQYLFGCNDN